MNSLKEIIPQKSNIFQAVRGIPLYDVFQRYLSGELRKSGSRFLSRCPFHEDRTPSFYLFPDNRYKCFGCGAHGDAVNLLAKLQGLRPIEAARLLAADFGIVVSDMGPEEYERHLSVVTEHQYEAAFSWKKNDVYSKLAMLHRRIFKNLKTFEDYQEFSGLLDIQLELEYVLDELQCRDSVRQLAALRYAKEVWGL